MAQRITIEDYLALGPKDRKAFDAWLEAEGLTQHGILGATIDGCEVDALCAVMPLEDDGTGNARTEQRRFTTSTPPPSLSPSPA